MSSIHKYLSLEEEEDSEEEGFENHINMKGEPSVSSLAARAVRQNVVDLTGSDNGEEEAEEEEDTMEEAEDESVDVQSGKSLLELMCVDPDSIRIEGIKEGPMSLRDFFESSSHNRNSRKKTKIAEVILPFYEKIRKCYQEGLPTVAGLVVLSYNLKNPCEFLNEPEMLLTATYKNIVSWAIIRAAWPGALYDNHVNPRQFYGCIDWWIENIPLRWIQESRINRDSAKAKRYKAMLNSLIALPGWFPVEGEYILNGEPRFDEPRVNTVLYRDPNTFSVVRHAKWTENWKEMINWRGSPAVQARIASMNQVCVDANCVLWPKPATAT